MKTFVYNDRTYEVEAKKMTPSSLQIAFLDEDDFGTILDWAMNADLSRIELRGEDDNSVEVYEGFTVFKAITALQATENDFWEGIRMVVALDKPITEQV